MPGFSATDRAGAPAPWNGSRTRWAPPLPYVALAALLTVTVLLTALSGVMQTAAPQFRPVHVAAAVAYLGLTAMIWFLAPLVPHGWGLDAAFVVTVLATAVAIWFSSLESTRILSGFVVVLLGVLAAYSLPRWRFVGALVLTLCAYGVAVLVSEPAIPMAYFLVVAIVAGAISVFVSVLVSQLREQALTDSLTGLLNRRGLDLMSTFIAADSARKGTPSCVALVDLNDFKAYNDEHGHLAGDRLLVEVGQALTLGVRGGDVVARFGGDEFALLLPGTTPKEAGILIERVARTNPGSEWSVGVAEWPIGQALDEALHAADQSMYEQKRSRG